MIFNYKVSHAKTTEETKLVLGPNGAPIDGTHKVLADGTGVVTVPRSRGKGTDPTEGVGGGAEIDIAVFAPRLRSDYSAMARAASAAGSHLILATYLAGDDAHFVDISNVMREVAGSGAAGLADCGSAFRSAIRNLYLTSPKGSVTPAADIALRGLLLTRDRHPTPIGYEVEARVVARSLAGLGLLGSAPVEDPLEPVSRARVVVPTIRQPDPAATSFEISGEPGDRVCLLLGIEGDSRFKDEKIDLDWKGAQAQFKIPVPAAPMGEIGNNGKILLTVPVAQCPPGLRAAAVLERGGPYGAASILVTPTIEIAPRPN